MQNESQEQYPPQMPMMASQDEEIKNIVGQIDPSNILKNLNHSLKGEYYNHEILQWEKIGEPLVNNVCRGWIISYFTSIMNNASTMGTISEKQHGYMMEGIIKTVNKTFRCNLEKFGFVPPGKYYHLKEFENKGSPDSARMDDVTEMIYRAAYLVLSRSVQGSESKKIFRSLRMQDPMMFQQEEKPQGRLSKFFSFGK